MGKRKAHKSKDELLKKLRRLERHIRRIEDDSSDDATDASVKSDLPQSHETQPREELEEDTAQETETPVVTNLVVTSPVEETLEAETAAEESLPEEVLKLLGDNGVAAEESKSCLPQLALRWEAILKSGLKKDTLEALRNKYKSYLKNCPSLVPPALNLEIKAAVAESAIKRDAKIVSEQKELAAIISSLGLAMTEIIKQNPNTQGLEMLSDSARLLCNLHFEISKNRRNLLVSGLNKDVKTLVDDMPIETMLFGNNFNEKIKANQAAKKLSAQNLKPVTVTNKVVKEKPKHHLNYKGPLRPQAPVRQSGQRSAQHKIKKASYSNHQQRQYKKPSQQYHKQ